MTFQQLTDRTPYRSEDLMSGKPTGQLSLSTVRRKIGFIAPTSDNYVRFSEIVKTVSRKNTPRRCRIQHIPGLLPEAVEQIDFYIGEYNKDPFSAQTIEEGMKTLNAVAEIRRKRWCETLENVDMRHDSRKACGLLRRLGNIPRRQPTPPKVTPNQIIHTLLLNCKPPKTNRKIQKKRMVRELCKELRNRLPIQTV